MAKTHTTTASLTVKIVVNDKGNPPGKLADAELHFGDGPLAGLKLIGFAVWERRSGVRPERDVSRPPVLGQRRAPEFRAAAADRGRHRAGAHPGSRPRGVRRVRGCGFGAVVASAAGRRRAPRRARLARGKLAHRGPDDETAR